MNFSFSSLITSVIISSFLIALLHFWIYYYEKRYFINPKHIILCIVLITVRFAVPCEFYYSITFPDNNILPAFSRWGQYQVPFIGINVCDLLLFVWLSVATAKMVIFVIKQNYIKKYIKELPNSSSMSLLYELVPQKNIATKIVVKRAPGIVSPLIVGLCNPKIIVPDDLNEEELRFVLLHEVQHHVHHDLYFKTFLLIVSTIYWWNPLFYVLQRITNKALEYRVDYAVTKDLDELETLDYLQCILNVAKRTKKKLFKYSISLGLSEQQSELHHRFENILHRNEKKTGKVLLALIFCMVIGSTFLVVEPYFVAEDVSKETFQLSEETCYFVINNDKYDLFLNGNYMMTVDSTSEFENIPVYNYKKETQ